MTRRVITAVATVTFLLAGMVVASAVSTASASSAPRLTVSPATGLRPGQIVVVRGAGFGAGQGVILAECPHEATRASSCSLQGREFAADTSAQGTFSQPIQVLRRPWGRAGRDCAVRYACEIGALQIGNGPFRLVAGANIWFNGASGPIFPHISVSPSSNLTPNQWVTVSGWGFSPEAPFDVVECSGLSATGPLFQHCAFPYGYGVAPGPIGGRQLGEPSGESVTTATGTFATRVRANSNVLIPFRQPLQPINCKAKPGCELAVESFDPVAPSLIPVSNIAFNPAAKPLTPLMIVSQTTGLADGQMISVTGGPFVPGETVVVRQCPTTTPVWEGCQIEDESFVTANDAGYIGVTFPVVEKSQPGRDRTNCTKVQCSISMFGVNDIWYSAWTPISLNPKLPPVEPEAAVSPGSALTNGQLVTVTGSKYAPGADVFVQECLRKATADCNQLNENVTADAAGSFDFGVNVQSTLQVFNPTGPNTTVSCGESACMLVVSNGNDPEQEALIPIAFSGT